MIHVWHIYLHSVDLYGKCTSPMDPMGSSLSMFIPRFTKVLLQSQLIDRISEPSAEWNLRLTRNLQTRPCLSCRNTTMPLQWYPRVQRWHAFLGVTPREFQVFPGWWYPLGGWTNPFEKYESNWKSFPKQRLKWKIFKTTTYRLGFELSRPTDFSSYKVYLTTPW